jgi:hypothetical protein
VLKEVSEWCDRMYVTRAATLRWTKAAIDCALLVRVFRQMNHSHEMFEERGIRRAVDLYESVDHKNNRR